MVASRVILRLIPAGMTNANAENLRPSLKPLPQGENVLRANLVAAAPHITAPASRAPKTLSARLAIALTLLSVVLWGYSPIGTRFMVGTGQSAVPPLPFIALRYGLAALIFSPALRLTRGWTAQDWRRGALCGLLGVTGFNLPVTIGQQTVSAGITGLLEATEPLMIVLLTAALLRRAPSRWTLAALFLGLTGIILLAHGAGPALGSPRGIALVLAGALLWALYCVLVTPLVTKRGALPTTAVTVLCGAIPMLLAGASALPATVMHLGAAQWAVTLALVLGASVTAMLSWNAGSAALGAQRAGWFLYLVPLVSLLGGASLLGEPIKTAEIFGGALILLSVALSQL